ncbi:Hypothetical_protein [Hexamita inflata]|uniref:Hypothetical_protein n=1 Tax=Hexamita inflata TaxID=28002 RepID=A0AA86U8V8_9EUKA|nr:Hypothetical protein HINF_LOCUS31051 [Hexamita inflata]
MEDLSEITIQIMQKDNVKDIHKKFALIQQFWDSIKNNMTNEKSLIEEPQQRINIEAMIVRESQHGKRNNRYQIQCDTIIMNNLLVTIEKRKKKLPQIKKAQQLKKCTTTKVKRNERTQSKTK